MSKRTSDSVTIDSDSSLSLGDERELTSGDAVLYSQGRQKGSSLGPAVPVSAAQGCALH